MFSLLLSFISFVLLTLVSLPRASMDKMAIGILLKRKLSWNGQFAVLGLGGKVAEGLSACHSSASSVLHGVDHGFNYWLEPGSVLYMCLLLM